MRILFFLWVVQGFAAFNLTWGTPAISLDANPPAGDTDGNAIVAIDPMGNGVAIWKRSVGQQAIEDIWASSYNHSFRVWTGAVKISGGGHATNGKAAMDARGNALFVWEEGFPSQIMSRALSANGVWTPPLASPPHRVHKSIYEQTAPQIKVDLQGNALAIWVEAKRGSRQIHSARKPFSMPWIGLGRISSGTGNAYLSETKTLCLNDAGKGIAVWEESGTIRAASYTKEGWSPPLPISSQGDSPAAGIDLFGHSLIVWHENGAIKSRAIVDGSLSPVLIASNPSYKSIHPDLMVDAMGNGVLVYERHNSLHKFITGTTLPQNSFSWSLPIDISGPSPADAEGAGYPVLALNEIGDGVVIWKEYTGDHLIIQGAGYSLGTWSLVKTLSSINDDSGSSIPGYDMSVALNLAGHVIAVWPEDPSLAGSFQLKANAATVERLPVKTDPPLIVENMPLPPESELSPEMEIAAGEDPSPRTEPKYSPITILKTTIGTGLANLAPFPPIPDPRTIISGVASGTQIRHKFPAHTDLINTLIWTCSTESVEYRIYRGNLASLIATSKEPRYQDHQRIPGKIETYLITSVDRHGQESSPMTLVVFPR